MRSAEDTNSQHFALFPHDLFSLGCEIRLGEKKVTSHLSASHQHWISQCCCESATDCSNLKSQPGHWGREMKGLTLMTCHICLSPAYLTKRDLWLSIVHWHSALAIAPKEIRVPGSSKAEGGLNVFPPWEMAPVRVQSHWPMVGCHFL